MWVYGIVGSLLALMSAFAVSKQLDDPGWLTGAGQGLLGAVIAFGALALWRSYRLFRVGRRAD